MTDKRIHWTYSIHSFPLCVLSSASTSIVLVSLLLMACGQSMQRQHLRSFFLGVPGTLTYNFKGVQYIHMSHATINDQPPFCGVWCVQEPARLGSSVASQPFSGESCNETRLLHLASTSNAAKHVPRIAISLSSQNRVQWKRSWWSDGGEE